MPLKRLIRKGLGGLRLSDSDRLGLSLERLCSRSFDPHLLDLSNSDELLVIEDQMHNIWP